jgi:hypothetical protein
MRPFVHGILTAIANSNLWMAMGAASLTAATQVVFGIWQWQVPLFVFFATVPAYCYMRVMKWIAAPQFRNGDLYEWVKAHHKLLMRFNFFMTLGALWTFSQLILNAKLAIIVPALMVLFYSFPYGGRNVGIRQVPGIKLWLISLLLVFVTVALPAIAAGAEITQDLVVHALQRLFFVMAVAIAFDIRDVESDTPEMKTIPQLYGVQRSRLIAFSLLALYDTSLLIQFFTGSFLSLPVLVALIVPSEMAALLIYLIAQPRSSLFYSLWMDAALVVWFPLLYLSSLI